MKILFWNAYHGFKKSKRHMLNPEEREISFAAWINAQKPDVVILLEMNGFDYESMSKYAKIWGHEHVMLTPGEFPIALSSNQIIRHPFFQQSGLCNGFFIASVGDMRLFITHIPPEEYTDRAKETREILPQIIHMLKRDESFLIMADLNGDRMDPMSKAFEAVGMTLLGEWNGVDHAMAAPSLVERIRNAEQIKDGHISSLSDHAPIVIEVKEPDSN